MEYTRAIFAENSKLRSKIPKNTYFITAEEEFLPLQAESLDLFVSNLNLHFNNSLELSLKKILESLKSDGCLVGNTYGSKTLEELRACFWLVENERSGGIGGHIYK